jgi:hypothetical protein
MLVRDANAVEEGTMWATWLYHHHHQSTNVADGVTVMSLSASIRQKLSAATDRLCQIVLNQKLLRKFKSGINFQVMLKQNCTKRNGLKQDLPVFWSDTKDWKDNNEIFTRVIQHCVASADDAVALNNWTIKNILICAHVQRERIWQMIRLCNLQCTIWYSLLWWTENIAHYMHNYIQI